MTLSKTSARDVWFHARHCAEWDQVSRLTHACAREIGIPCRLIVAEIDEHTHQMLLWDYENDVQKAAQRKAESLFASDGWRDDIIIYKRWYSLTAEERAELVG